MGVKAHKLTYWEQEAGEIQKEWKIEPLPAFTEDTVRSTIMGLLTMRQTFFAERVDGLFQALSRDHVTNSPEGFGKRMILNRVINFYGHSDTDTCGYINDLRCVIAKFMGRDEPNRYTTEQMATYARAHPGQWVTLDGGSLRIRCYKKGTGHLEVHPDMAWRLNAVLANLYPMAIPSQFRSKPKRKTKEFAEIQKPLPFSVVEVLLSAKKATELIKDGHRDEYREIRHSLNLNSYQRGDSAYQEAEEVLRVIGGVKIDHYFQFEYDPVDVVKRICVMGCIPDQQASQFYPTPKSLGEIAVEMANIGPNDLVLEPQAGQGDLADLLPKDRTTCVEQSELRASILRAKGYTDVHATDFIAWATSKGPLWDRIVMNPPFDQGRAVAHTEAAYTLLKPGGVLVAVLPASLRGKPFLRGDTQWSQPQHGCFVGTGVSVVIMRIERPE